MRKNSTVFPRKTILFMKNVVYVKINNVVQTKYDIETSDSCHGNVI